MLGKSEKTAKRLNDAMERAVVHLAKSALQEFRSIVKDWEANVTFDVQYDFNYNTGLFAFDIIATDEESDSYDTIAPSDIFKFVDEGTVEHDIPDTPTEPGFPLMFMYEGNVISKRQVHVQGIDPKHYSTTVLSFIEDRMPMYVQASLASELSKIAKEGGVNYLDKEEYPQFAYLFENDEEDTNEWFDR